MISTVIDAVKAHWLWLLIGILLGKFVVPRLGVSAAASV